MSTAAIRSMRQRKSAVEVRAALALVGTLVKYLSVSAVFPAGVALWYREPPWPFVFAGLIAFGSGVALEHLRGDVRRVGFREGYLVVALTWLLAAVYGSLPYLLSADIQLDRPVDALFETMSGFTTTGATVLVDVEAVDHSLLMWRQFTQWLGGMGIIVLALAVLPRLRVGGRQLMESEMPGPEMDDLAARIRSTAQRLWLLYVALTLIQIGILTAFGVFGIDRRMGLFEAVSTAFTTMPTGGFMPDGRSLEEFAAASQWVVTLFMVIAGVNFALAYRALVRRSPRLAFRDEELRLYLGILAAAAAIVTIELWSAGFYQGEAAIRHATFQVASIMTTTGFASVDYVIWPALTLMILIALMFVGGSAGSTARLDQGRSASSRRTRSAPRAPPDAAPGVGSAGEIQRQADRRAHPPGDHRVHVPLPRCVGDRHRDHRDRRCRARPAALRVRSDRRHGYHPRERGARAGGTGPDGLIRVVLRPLDPRVHRAHVARTARGDPDRVGADAWVLARVMLRASLRARAAPRPRARA